MRKTMLLALLMFVVTHASQATEPCEYSACMEYLTTNISVRTPFDYGVRSGGTNGPEIIWNIRSMAKPTFAQLDAVKDKALAWKSNQVAEAAANIDGMDFQARSVLRALVKLVNDRLPVDKRITEDDLKAAIKAEALADQATK